MDLDLQAGKGVSEAGDYLFSSPSSSASSFRGFVKSSCLMDGARSTVPKVKSIKKKTLKTQKVRSRVPSKVSRAPSPVPSTSKASTSGKGSLTKQSKEVPPPPSFDAETFAELLMQKLNKRADDKLSQLSSQLSSSNASVLSLSQQVKSQGNLISEFMSGGAAARPFSVPDTSSLPPFDKGNPWRLTLYAPQHEGTLTIEGLGTRRLEELEFFPPGLEPPYPSFARLTEEAWIRSDKVPKETVIFPRDQAQSSLLRTLTEWQAENTKLTPAKGAFTMFSLGEILPTPCTSKVASLTGQACMEGKPLPHLRETDPTSRLPQRF